MAENMNSFISSFENGFLSYIQGYYRYMSKPEKIDEKFEALLVDLSRILYYVNDERCYVPVSEELAFITNYMKIQEMRFGHIQFINMTDKSLYGFSIKKLSLFLYIEKAINSEDMSSSDTGKTISLFTPRGERKICLSVKTDYGFYHPAGIKLSRKRSCRKGLPLYKGLP